MTLEILEELLKLRDLVSNASKDNASTHPFCRRSSARSNGLCFGESPCSNRRLASMSQTSTGDFAVQKQRFDLSSGHTFPDFEYDYNYEPPTPDQVECYAKCAGKYRPSFGRTPDWHKYWQCICACEEEHVSPETACYAKCDGEYCPIFGRTPDSHKYWQCIWACEEEHASPERACYAKCDGKYHPSFGRTPNQGKFLTCQRKCSTFGEKHRGVDGQKHVP